MRHLIPVQAIPRAAAENPFTKTGAAKRSHHDEVRVHASRRFEDCRPSVGARSVGSPHLRLDAMASQKVGYVERWSGRVGGELLRPSSPVSTTTRRAAVRNDFPRITASAAWGAAVPGDEDACSHVEEWTGGGNDQHRAASGLVTIRSTTPQPSSASAFATMTRSCSRATTAMRSAAVPSKDCQSKSMPSISASARSCVSASAVQGSAGSSAAVELSSLT